MTTGLSKGLPPWRFSMGKGSLPIRLYLQLMDRFFQGKHIKPDEKLNFYIMSLDELIQKSLNESTIEDVDALKDFLVRTFAKDLDIVECVSLLRSLNKDQREHMNDYVIRLQFFVGVLGGLLKQDEEALLLILFLNGLPLTDEEVKEQYQNLANDLKASQKNLSFSAKAKSEEQNRGAKRVDKNTVKSEDPEDQGGMAVTRNLIFDQISKVKPGMPRSKTSRLPKPPRRRFTLKLGRTSEGHGANGLKDRMRKDVKTTINDINWENPIMPQFVQDKSYSETVVCVCALCVRLGKKDILQSKQDLFQHAKDYHDGHLAACDGCSFTSKGRNEMIIHRYTKHEVVTPGYNKEICPMDGCDFTSLIDLPIQNTHPNERKKGVLGYGRRHKYVCRIKTNIKDIDWEKPIIYQFIEDSSYSNELFAVCAICVRDGQTEIIPSEHEFYKHSKTVHEGHLAACDHCSYTAKTYCRMASHRYQKHQAVSLGYPEQVCPRDGCKFTYVFKPDLKTHIKYNHEKDSTPGMCPQCGKIYKNRLSVKKHIRIEHEGIREKCNICSKTYWDKSLLKYHMDTAHKGLRHRYERICEQCGLKCISSYSLATHIQRDHNKQRNFKCQLCPKEFFTRRELANHEKGVHKFKTDHVCPHCNRGCPTAYTLKVHINTHLKKREFHCKLCDNWYTASHTLALHITTKHMGFSKEEGNKKENILAAKNHEAYEKIVDKDEKNDESVPS